MSRTRIHYLLAATCTVALFLLATGAGLTAEVTRQTFTPPPPPKLSARFVEEKIASEEAITRGFLIAETNQFSFVLPRDFRCTVDGAGKKVTLTSVDFACTLDAVIRETATDGKADLRPEVLRPRVLERFPASRITDEFTATIESMSGPGFELESPTANGVGIVSRIAFVPYAGGHIEISFQAAKDQLQKYQPSFNQLLLSLRSSPIGAKLEVQQFLSNL